MTPHVVCAGRASLDTVVEVPRRWAGDAVSAGV